MRTHRETIVVAVIVALCGGYMAQGQIREKPAEAVKKAINGASKPVEPVRKPAEAPKAAEDPEEKSVRASAESFTKLYNAHDAGGLAALFASKAEMIDEEGRVVKGQAAIEKAFAEVFQEHPQISMVVNVESVRVLTPVLAIEEGTVTSKDSPDDPESATVYVAIHVKTDGQWRLACVRDWDAPPAEPTPNDHLQELAWMVGEWIDESPGSAVHSVCNWHDNGNFLMQEYQVNIGGVVAMSGTTRIGWDAVARQFKSWVFDSHGGHSMGAWSWDGERWIVKMQGATARGEVGSSTNYYRRIDDETIAWGSFDRLIDGERQEDIPEIIVKRRPPRPSE